MSQPSLDKLAALRGTYIINNTAEVTTTIYGVLVLEDTVIASLEVAGVDVKADYVAAPATAIKAGAYITPLSGVEFNAITLTSGSVSIVLG
jgi:hypothetical protein